MHNCVPEEPAVSITGEMDQFGYYRCRRNCGKTYKTKQGRNRYPYEISSALTECFFDNITVKPLLSSHPLFGSQSPKSR